MENADLVDTFLGVITKLDYFWGSFYAFTGLFFKFKVKNSDFFGGLPIFLFLGAGGGGGVGRTVDPWSKLT